MSSLKRALERVIRVVQHPPAPRLARPQNSYDGAAVSGRLPPKTRRVRRRPVPHREHLQVKAQVGNLQRKKFRQFLDPLDIPQLKIYDDNVAPYDVHRAEQNLRLRRSLKPTDIFINFLNEKVAFKKMVQWLVDLTPGTLKGGHVVHNVATLQSVLADEEAQFSATRYAHTPRYHFHELPPIPDPLTPDSFQEYIYFLTHCRILYRNSGSLQSGIVPDILLHTHRLDNVAFRKCRSADTYNYLIKYFGHDKFQVSFAKELLLVMIKDGHVPNVDTINTLIKICKRHSVRRALTLSFSLVLKYLQLAKKFDVALNLSTWNRVYDCIQNVLLKEQFVNKICAERVPVLANLAVRIIEDYSASTSRTQELVEFVEKELGWAGWRGDSRVCNKVLQHRLRHSSDPREVGETLAHMLPHLQGDVVTVKAAVDAMEANTTISAKEAMMLGVFLRLLGGETPPETLGKVVAAMCRTAGRYEVRAVCSIVRGLIHDACIAYQLPEEYLEYEDAPGKRARRESKRASRRSTSAKRGLSIPIHRLAELYRIIKRLTRNSLNDMEAAVLYANKTLQEPIPMPHEKLSASEAVAWEELKKRARSPGFWDKPCATLGLTPAARQTPAAMVHAYRAANYASMSMSHTGSLLEKLRSGPQQHLMQELHRRKIIDSSQEF